jgi:hypothetical protein
MQVGDKVRVLPPFDSFNGEYIIAYFDGETYFLEGIIGGFAPKYLEKV